MKKFQISESQIDGSIYLTDESGKIFLPSNPDGAFKYLTLESANQIGYFTDGQTIFSATTNGLGWITEAINAGLQIFGAVSSSQQQKKANASAERQLQLQNEQLEIQARIQQQKAEIEQMNRGNNKTSLIVGSVLAVTLFGIAIVVIVNRNKKKKPGRSEKKTSQENED